MAKISTEAGRTTRRTFPEMVLPDAHNLEIGRIVVASAKLENKLKRALYWAADVNSKTGRLLAKPLRAEEYPSLILDLLESRGIFVWQDRHKKNKKANPLKPLKDLLSKATEGRDKIVHSLWIRMPGEERPVLQRIEGHRHDMPGESITRRLYPEPEAIDAEELASIQSDVESALSKFETFVKTIKLETARTR